MLDARALENAALHYLERYASSAENLRRVLQRKVRRAAEDGRAKVGEAEVSALVERFRAAGLLDDATYAEGRAQSLARQGASRRAIAQRLAAKGVDRDTITAAMGEGDDLAAACRLARRRRLGPYRTGAPAPAKDLAALGRAGFSYDVARRVLACATIDEVEALISEPNAQ